MIRHSLDKTNSILLVAPDAPLQKSDFDEIASVIDPFIASSGSLSGLIIDASSFSGWGNFAAMVSHFRFVHDHHQRISKLALVTDSAVLGHVAEHLAEHFVAAEIRRFPAGQVQPAKQWIMQQD
ncbi:MAG: STAS/SEC14 domain-containing protein [Gammaproteobacteria bacterium]|jgi:hypothetical protein|nr:STAS/SEC14 domain-containing protein [Gammaproteobacteria bacterium]